MLDGIISFLERIHIKEPKKPPRKPEPDVISSLPQPIISHIASFLPTEEAIRSTILSTSWRNVCSSLSNLEFNQAYFKKKKLDSEVFSRFVSHTLRSHDGSDVHKFTLEAYFETLPEPMLVNEWISFAVQHNVKEIYISLHTMTPVTLPCCLFTSPTITLLDLFDFRLKLPSVIHLSNLQHLQIESLYFCNEMSLINLFSNLSCPLVNSCCVVSCPPYIPDLIPKSGWNLRSFSIANTVVHPAPGNANGTLVNGILHHCALPNILSNSILSDLDDDSDAELTGSHDDRSSSMEIGSSIRPGIVHRLDKGTSGLLVVAKDEYSHAHLSEQFKQHTIHRVYISLTSGVPTTLSGRVEVPIGRDINNRIRMAAIPCPSVSRQVRHAASRYKVIEVLAGGGSALVEWILRVIIHW
ncbi:hypothetical protein IFM89_005342 [Coptis chinensis]|uniref:F-box domain-containing protein n=1 Tax=Coptis chinensis TaxID=261450 RepID=A0A835LQI6_9MAGN|nr:hypothetical protein IFM89_005342 [Coptis chinensis]